MIMYIMSEHVYIYQTIDMCDMVFNDCFQKQELSKIYYHLLRYHQNFAVAN